ncbi:DUF898 family protein [Sagittula sp. NFXS13]|uniref:YjgN family protein n=1 Tax=Sagittula sp. NFXS13 TaxID=2819095 RepID=UPI0032E04FBB
MALEQNQMAIEYSGSKGPLFGLTLKTGLLSLITLGLYRFWQKTRIRKYIWSSVNAGGDTFEYTGTGLEKFLGFLVAIVFLAIYLGLVQMVLFYFGLNMMVDPDTASNEQIVRQMAALYISALAVMPFILFAIYRARRYKMARTRFRGIRLGMKKGAWGYVIRAMGYGLLSIVTLGLLSPLMTFRLEKFMTDRSFYGTTSLRQDGKWTALYPAMKHVFIGLGILLASGVAFGFGMANETIALAVLGGLLIFVGYVWLMVGMLCYGVWSFGYLMSHKVVVADTPEDEIRFDARPRTRQVIKTYILGGLLLALLSSIVFGAVAVLVTPFMLGMEDAFMTDDPSGQSGMMFRMVGAALVAGIGYLVGIVVMQALSMILITQPILAHYIETITVLNPAGLDRVSQREALTGIDADGFADALDIGGAI